MRLIRSIPAVHTQQPQLQCYRLHAFCCTRGCRQLPVQWLAGPSGPDRGGLNSLPIFCWQGNIYTNNALPELSPEHRRAVYHGMATTLAALHSVKPEDVGLQGYGRMSGYCSRQVGYSPVLPSSTPLIMLRAAHLNQSGQAYFRPCQVVWSASIILCAFHPTNEGSMCRCYD